MLGRVCEVSANPALLLFAIVHDLQVSQITLPFVANCACTVLSGFEEHDAGLERSYFLAIQPFSFLFSAAPRHVRKGKHVHGHMVTCNLVHVTLCSSLARSYFLAKSSLAVLRQTVLRDPTVLYMIVHYIVQSRTGGVQKIYFFFP